MGCHRSNHNILVVCHNVIIINFCGLQPLGDLSLFGLICKSCIQNHWLLDGGYLMSIGVRSAFPQDMHEYLWQVITHIGDQQGCSYGAITFYA